MTAAQNDALATIENLMREHFTAAIITVVGEVEDEDKKEDIRTVWNGGAAAAYGMCHLAVQNLNIAYRRK